MVHLTEWTTGAALFLAFGPFSAIFWELVVYLTEWTTGSMLFLTFDPFSAISWELVGHFPEWATGSMPFLAFEPFPAFSEELVDHWLKQKPCTDRQCRALSLVFKTFNVLVGLETSRAAIAGGCYNLAQVLLTHVAGCKNAWQASGHVIIRDDPAFCVGNS